MLSKLHLLPNPDDNDPPRVGDFIPPKTKMFSLTGGRPKPSFVQSTMLSFWFLDINWRRLTAVRFFRANFLIECIEFLRQAPRLIEPLKKIEITSYGRSHGGCSAAPPICEDKNVVNRLVTILASGIGLRFGHNGADLLGVSLAHHGFPGVQWIGKKRGRTSRRI